MTPIDWAIVATLGLSVLLGVVRGVVREMFALAGWIVGVLLALQFAAPIGNWLPLELPLGARTALAGLVLVVGTLLAAALVAALLRAMLSAVKLSIEDRLLGGVFGVLRGVIVIGVAVLIAIGAGAPRQAWWQASALLPMAQASVRFASPLLPESLARYVPHAAKGEN
jgi:membrane protein required for colicin V production